MSEILGRSSSGCWLVLSDGRPLILRAVDVRASARAGLASVRLLQRFHNPYPETLTATLHVPLPDDSAVLGMALTIDGRRYVGHIEKVDDARERYQRAIEEGEGVSLLQQLRSSFFQQDLGNLAAGADVTVEIEVEHPLRWSAGGWEWRWPTVIGPRYLGAPGQVRDAARIALPASPDAPPVRCSASLQIGEAQTSPSSPSHALGVDGPLVTLDGVLDRDLVVRWPAAAEIPAMQLECARLAGDPDAFGWLALTPPRAETTPIPRDLCLLIDASGSMDGEPLRRAVAICSALIRSLSADDRLEMIVFADDPVRWRTLPAAIDEASRADALQWLARLEAGGGTDMHEAIIEALRPLDPGSQRQIVLLTDGYIGFESEILAQLLERLPPSVRLHTVGIGEAPNRTLTRGAARAAGGLEALAGLDLPVDEILEDLLGALRAPLWTDLSISGAALREHAPRRIPDLMAGRPARVALRLDPAGGALTVSARGPSGPVVLSQIVPALPEGEGRAALRARFGREKIDDLEILRAASGPRDAREEPLDAEIAAVGLDYQIASRATAWIALSERPLVDPSAPSRHELVPQALPRGTTPGAFGLNHTRGALAGSVTSMLLLDVTPLSLGVLLEGSRFGVVLPRNTTIPVLRRIEATGRASEQGILELTILQGESAQAEEDLVLGTLRIEGLPPGPVALTVAFDLDANGILTVSAQRGDGPSTLTRLSPGSSLGCEEIERLVQAGRPHEPCERYVLP